MKTCSKCGEERPLDDFPYKNKQQGKRHARCKNCARDYIRGRRGKSTKRKKCSTCGERKFFEDFPWKVFGKTRHGKCKECQRWYSKSHYERLTPDQRQQANKRRHARKRRVIAENRQLVFDFLTEHPCVDCGESDPVVLEFDHVRGEKAANVAEMLTRDFAWSTIKTEIEKCDARCANCHRRRSSESLGWWRSQ